MFIFHIFSDLAREHCRGQKSELATIDDEAEQLLLEAQIQTNVYIGITDGAEEGVFKNSAGEVATYFK